VADGDTLGCSIALILVVNRLYYIAITVSRNLLSKAGSRGAGAIDDFSSSAKNGVLDGADETLGTTLVGDLLVHRGTIRIEIERRLAGLSTDSNSQVDFNTGALQLHTLIIDFAVRCSSRGASNMDIRVDDIHTSIVLPCTTSDLATIAIVLGRGTNARLSLGNSHEGGEPTQRSSNNRLLNELHGSSFLLGFFVGRYWKRLFKLLVLNINIDVILS
jgi:hypothetical protein